MADDPNDDPNLDDDLADENDGLRRELANLRAVLAERRDDMVAAASRGAQAVVTPIRENPAVVSSVFIMAGLLAYCSGWPSANRNSGPGIGMIGIAERSGGLAFS
jgi:hypothetical protein